MGRVEEYLKNIGVDFKVHEHKAVYTVEEAKKERKYSKIRGLHSKNLFLKDKKSKNYYLVIIPDDKRLNLNLLGEKLDFKIKFAGSHDLNYFLGLNPGSVSPFGLINDVKGVVKVLVHEAVWSSKIVSFHPNINTKTLELSGSDFHKYIKSLKNSVRIIGEKWL